MTKTRLYIARHGKPCLIPLRKHRAGQTLQLTEAGERGIREQVLVSRKLGFLLKRLSILTRTKTMGIILQELSV